MPNTTKEQPMTGFAIREANLLNKMSFVLTGSGVAISDFGKRLEAYRQEYEFSPSRQAISNWLDTDKTANPTKKNSLIFLKSFIDNSVIFDKLLPEQKKVYNQIRSFFSEKLSKNADKSRPNTLGPYDINKDGFFIRSNATRQDYEDFGKTWNGWYRSYRYRLIRNEKRPYAAEIVHIERKGLLARYKHWHRRNGIELSEFEGGILIGEHTIWLMGASKTQNRLRICHFKNVNIENPIHERFRWGLMHSDMPDSASHEPASTRILLEKIDNDISPQHLISDTNIRYMALEEIPQETRKYAQRLISNKYSAVSLSNSLEPAEIDDHALRVDQKTIQMACSDYNDEYGD